MERLTSGGQTATRDGAPVPSGSALVAILLGVAGGAWLISARLATPDMRLGVLTGASMMPSAMSMALSVFIAAWTVMMAAMMVPSLLPTVRAFNTWARATGQSSSATALVVAGYLLVWSMSGGVAYLAVQALQGAYPVQSMASLQAGAVLLVVAGIYQLTPPKQACLRLCRSSHTSMASPVIARVRGHLGALRVGLRQGVYCLGSSWPLMLVLLMVGMMNLAWMSVISGIIFLEKVAPRGIVVSKAVGWGLVGSGIVLLAAPHTLPALG